MGACILVAPGGYKVRIDPRTRSTLVLAHLQFAVVIAEDVSVQVVGSVQSVFTKLEDANREAERLSEMYAVADAFVVVDLGRVG